MRYDRGRQSKFIDRNQQVRFALELAIYAMLLPLFFLVISLADPIAGLIMGRTPVQPLVYASRRFITPSPSLLQCFMNGFEVMLDLIFLRQHHAFVFLTCLFFFIFR